MKGKSLAGDQACVNSFQSTLLILMRYSLHIINATVLYLAGLPASIGSRSKAKHQAGNYSKLTVLPRKGQVHNCECTKFPMKM